MIVILVALLCRLSCPAEGYRYMVIDTSLGSSMTVKLSSDLSTTFNVGEMILKSDYLYLELPLSFVKSWRYVSNVFNGLDDILNYNDDVTLTDTGDCITIDGLSDNSKIQLSTLAGQILVSDEASESYTLPLDRLTNGIYIVAVNNRTFKISVDR